MPFSNRGGGNLRKRTHTIIKGGLKRRALLYTALFAALFLLAGCPAPPLDPPIADCPTGYAPCADDSTECCPIECPPGYELVGDSCQVVVTNNNFIWTTTRIVPVTPWAIYDIEIIAENDVWLVGMFEHPDSTRWDSVTLPPNPPIEDLYAINGTYNAAHWDGEKWTLSVIFTYDYQYRVSFQPIRTVSAITHDDVRFFCDYGGLSRWNGDSIEYGWGGWAAGALDAYVVNETEMWFCGLEGTVGYWTPTGYHRVDLPSYTKNHFKSITARRYATDGMTRVWLTGANSSASPDFETPQFWHYNGLEWTKVWERSTGGLFQDPEVYQVPEVYAPDNYWLVAFGRSFSGGHHGFLSIHKQSDLTDYREIVRLSSNQTAAVIRGNAVNDFFMYGIGSGPSHWNGEELVTFNEAFNGDGLNMAMDFKGDHVFAADRFGYVYHGIR